jgi:hypothetical protein
VLRLGPDDGEEARGQPRGAPEDELLGCHMLIYNKKR